ncbi:hypothetical protein AGOR_G00087070 [Albula goreensis]|uniref:Serpin domain-containing protein n=1 Tax=Albula goreensis TaxID=1534307 RepID=A0A8T3DR40_9TELE|nr:hypothetical protein AGOR_G00087070 [Albula goreensis]
MRVTVWSGFLIRKTMDAAPITSRLLLLFFACLVHAADIPGGHVRAGVATNQMDDLSDHLADLAFSLYRGLIADRPSENVLLSPLAISEALAFLAEGSGSQTRTEILSALGTTGREVWRDLARSLSGEEGQLHHLATGSSLHIEKTFGLSPKSQNHSRGDGKGAVRIHAVDFSNPQRAQESINSFIGRETRGNVSEFLQSLNTSAKSVLANYMYFKGRWEQPFARRHTVNWRFQVNETLVVEVPMMFRAESKELKMLYDTNCSSTVVRLPMNFWLNNLKSGWAEVRLPRFVLRKLYPLKTILKPTGVRTLFTDSADLSGFTPHKKLGLQALHEAILEVDETELENHGAKDTMLDFSEPQRIVFDRPFTLLIYHEPTGAILLMGKITNPAEK